MSATINFKVLVVEKEAKVSTSPFFDNEPQLIEDPKSSNHQTKSLQSLKNSGISYAHMACFSRAFKNIKFKF